MHRQTARPRCGRSGPGRLGAATCSHATAETAHCHRTAHAHQTSQQGLCHWGRGCTVHCTHGGLGTWRPRAGTPSGGRGAQGHWPQGPPGESPKSLGQTTGAACSPDAGPAQQRTLPHPQSLTCHLGPLPVLPCLAHAFHVDALEARQLPEPGHQACGSPAEGTVQHRQGPRPSTGTHWLERAGALG